MEFKTRKEVEEFIEKSKYIGGGSQGECYVDSQRENVYKIYYNFLDPIEEDTPIEASEILQFQDINSGLVMFPKDIIAINGDIIGDISKYARGKNLDTLNPLLVDLNHLIKLCRLAIKEIELLSRKRVILYDVVFNTLLGDNLYIVDTKDYSWSLESYEETLKNNIKQFNLSILWFLIDDLFESIIEKNKLLREMYKTEGLDISVIDFIIELKNYLSEILGREISTLGDARSLMNKNHRRTFYKRSLVLY